MLELFISLLHLNVKTLVAFHSNFVYFLGDGILPTSENSKSETPCSLKSKAWSIVQASLSRFHNPVAMRCCLCSIFRKLLLAFVGSNLKVVYPIYSIIWYLPMDLSIYFVLGSVFYGENRRRMKRRRCHRYLIRPFIACNRYKRLIHLPALTSMANLAIIITTIPAVRITTTIAVAIWPLKLKASVHQTIPAKFTHSRYLPQPTKVDRFVQCRLITGFPIYSFTDITFGYSTNNRAGTIA